MIADRSNRFSEKYKRVAEALYDLFKSLWNALSVSWHYPFEAEADLNDTGRAVEKRLLASWSQ